MIKTSTIGRLTGSSKLRVMSTGKVVASFISACKRERLDKDGNAQTTFIQCVIWGKPAEVLAEYTQKGSLIAVNGELQSRFYGNQQGQTHCVTELVVTGLELLESKGAVQNREQKQQVSEITNAEPSYGIEDMEPPVYQ